MKAIFKADVVWISDDNIERLKIVRKADSSPVVVIMTMIEISIQDYFENIDIKKEHDIYIYHQYIKVKKARPVLMF